MIKFFCSSTLVAQMWPKAPKEIICLLLGHAMLGMSLPEENKAIILNSLASLLNVKETKKDKNSSHYQARRQPNHTKDNNRISGELPVLFHR